MTDVKEIVEYKGALYKLVTDPEEEILPEDIFSLIDDERELPRTFNSNDKIYKTTVGEAANTDKFTGWYVYRLIPTEEFQLSWEDL